MTYRASEILYNALNLSQLNQTEALDWKRKITMFNTAFTTLWDKVISHEDDFVLQKIELPTPAQLPADLYSIRAVYHRNDQLRRCSTFGRLYSDQYRIVDNAIETSTEISGITLYYNKKPPTITFPNNPVTLDHRAYKMRHETVAYYDPADQLFHLEDIITGDQYTQTGNIAYEWDIFNGNVVQNVSGSLTINGTVVDTDVSDFIVNAYLDYKKADDTCWRVDYNNNLFRLPEFYTFAHYICGLPYTFENNILYQGDTEIETYQKVIFADPYILVKDLDNNWWVFVDGNKWRVESKGEVITASWNDENGYGIITQTPRETVLHSFYPDTVLDWPSTMYFDWLEAALAVDMRKQVEQDTSAFEAMKEERWAILQSHLNRNRGDAYKINNPYSARGGY
jgi:hypothetical protein